MKKMEPYGQSLCYLFNLPPQRTSAFVELLPRSTSADSPAERKAKALSRRGTSAEALRQAQGPSRRSPARSLRSVSLEQSRAKRGKRSRGTETSSHSSKGKAHGFQRRRIKEIFQQKGKTYSFELFPPKTEQGYQNLLKTIGQLCALKPDFISCTYGAGGGGRDKTFDIVQHIQEKHQTIAVAHLTCVLHTKDEIKKILENIKSRGIKNVLALRGDPPQDHPDWQPGKNNFKYSSELCAFIRRHFGDYFGIGVAGFPEGHILCKDRELDARYLKIKIDNGADFVITQLFFDNKDYFEYVERLKKLGVRVRIIPGILPITHYQNLLRFCDMCGATVTEEVKKIFEPIQDDAHATLNEGVRFAIRQCRELLTRGAPGLHFYCLNKVSPTDQILSAVRKSA